MTDETKPPRVVYTFKLRPRPIPSGRSETVLFAMRVREIGWPFAWFGGPAQCMPLQVRR